MTVSKRIRFEVLRRDEFRCFYCHTAEGELQIDHVVPTALGGSDDPLNLVAACPACNSGKASTSPDAALVEAVDKAAAIHQAGAARVMQALEGALDDFDYFEEQVIALWDEAVPSYRQSNLRFPDDMASTLYSWHRSGVPIPVIRKGVRIAVGNQSVPWSGKFRYAAGVVTNTIREAEGLIAQEFSNPAYHAGWRACLDNLNRRKADPSVDSTEDPIWGEF